jgi:hypothetical protein
MIKHLNDPLPRPSTFVPNLPAVVEQVLFKALAKEPKNRYQSMTDFATALERLIQGEASVLSPIMQDIETLTGTKKTVLTSIEIPTLVPPAPKSKVMESWVIILAAVAGLVTIGLLCILAGGTFFVSRSLLNPKQSPDVAGVTTHANGQITQPTSSPVTPPTLNPLFPLMASPEPTPTALQSIAGFPDDIPFLKENNGDLTTTVETNAKMYFFSSNLSEAELSDFYQKGMAANGWKLDYIDRADHLSLNFSKSETNSVSITFLNRGKDIMVNIRIWLPTK